VQPPVTQPTTTASTILPSLGTIDFGVRGLSTTGDEARSQRYRDLRNGAFSRILVGRDTDQYRFSLRAENIGYLDQRYFAGYNSGKANVVFQWDSTPLNYSFQSATPWVEASPNVFTLDPSARLAVQNKALGVIGVPSTAAQLQTASIFRGLSSGFDMQSRRDAANVSLGYVGENGVGMTMAFTTTKRSGNQPWGASFAFNNANELPMSLDNRTNDIAAGLEWASHKGMIRLGWDGSWFDNRLQQLVWDNPIRATDTTPFDPSGYSNGNGPAQGRMSVAPSNSLNTVSGSALYKMPAHTTVNGTVSFTDMRQNDALIPWTINPAIANATVYKTFPGLASLPRTSAEASVHGVNAMVNLTSRPNRYVGLTARYRFNDHVNLTPVFDAREYVRFDAVPEETGGETEQFNITENTVDLSATFNLMKYTSLRVGYGYDSFDRTGRAFNNMTDNTLRASLDTVGNQYLTIRGIYEYTQRKGSGFAESAIEDGGAQPGLRFYDEADRDRNKGTLVFAVNPMDMVDLTFSVAAGKDVYKGPGHDFGLLNNSNTSFNVGINLNPARSVAFGANYGRDHFSSDQKSRNANPPPDPQFTDPSRDWTLNNTENVNNFNLYLDLPKAIQKTDVRLSYDFSDSDNGFLFGGPRIASLSAAGQFLPLPDVTNRWHRLAVDIKYFFHPKVAVGLGYWYEKFDVSDFATVDITGNPGTPRIDYLGEISTGYGNRPYKVNTGFLRLVYLF
jgi:MtrB/PioB family decaheme-associated outer membrane protein